MIQMLNRLGDFLDINLLRFFEPQFFPRNMYLKFRVLNPLNAELDATVYAPKSLT